MSQVLTLYVDPGEDTGWCLATPETLVAGGTIKLWKFAHAVWEKLSGQESELDSPGYTINSYDEPFSIDRIVYEEFRLYPWAVYTPTGGATHAHDFDEFRTVQLIGALRFMADLFGIEAKGQPAKIKKQALLAGAEEYFGRPLHENRHMNDAIQHWVFHHNDLRVQT